MPLLFSCRYVLIGGLLMVGGVTQAQTPRTSGAGLRATYYAGRKFEQLVLTRLDTTIDFDWSYGPHAPGQPSPQFVAPGPGVPAENFSVRWTGYLYAPTTGVYTLQILADDGMRVWLGDRRVLNSWRNQAVTRTTTSIRLRAGRYYALRVEYYQVQWYTRAQLAWLPPAPVAALGPWAQLTAAVGFAPAPTPQAIPARYLYAALPISARLLSSPPPLPPTVASEPAPPIKPPASTAKPARFVARTPPTSPPVVPLAPAQPTVLPPPLPDTAATLSTLVLLTKGVTLTLPNLYFTRSTAALLPTSYPTLNALARTLHQQPALRLTIAGHTDNVGAARLNQRLSEQRAQVVRRYLVQQGIDSLRLTAVGYGGTRPVADNRDPRQRPRNRRVEVVVQ